MKRALFTSKLPRGAVTRAGFSDEGSVTIDEAPPRAPGIL